MRAFPDGTRPWWRTQWQDMNERGNVFLPTYREGVKLIHSVRTDDLRIKMNGGYLEARRTNAEHSYDVIDRVERTDYPEHDLAALQARVDRADPLPFPGFAIGQVWAGGSGAERLVIEVNPGGAVAQLGTMIVYADQPEPATAYLLSGTGAPWAAPE